jgi:hypothetical protein
MKVLIAIIGWAKGATNGDHQVMRDTWLKDITHPDVSYKFFIGDGTPMTEDETQLRRSVAVKCGHPSVGKPQPKIEFTPQADEILVPTPDDYTHITAKSREAFRWAVAQGFDYIFTCYPDTFVNVDRLLKSGFTGHDYTGLSIGYAKGGQGRWLSRKAAMLVMNESVTDWAEDRWVGQILARKGILLHNDRRYVDYPLAPAPGNDYITSHLAEMPIRYDQNLTRKLYQPHVPDVVISVTKDFGWNDLKCYANSLARCFRGTKLFFVENITEEARKNLLALGFILVDYHSTSSNFWLSRYKVASEYMEANSAKFRYVIWADCRDLVFQADPSTWMEKHLAPHRILGSGECWLIKNEALNDQWVRENVPTAHAWLREQEVLCGGTVAGDSEMMRMFFREMTLRLQAREGLIDQPILNHVLRISPFKEVLRVPRMREGFAITFSSLVRGCPLTDSRPVFDYQQALAYAPETRVPFVIVHQYDRDPNWARVVAQQYGTGTPQGSYLPPAPERPVRQGRYAKDGLTIDWFDSHPRR